MVHPAIGHHEAVRRGIAGGDAEAERLPGEAPILGAEDGGGGEGRGGRAGDELAAIQHGGRL